MGLLTLLEGQIRWTAWFKVRELKSGYIRRNSRLWTNGAAISPDLPPRAVAIVQLMEIGLGAAGRRKQKPEPKK
jgi:hypothetical protein